MFERKKKKKKNVTFPTEIYTSKNLENENFWK